MPPFIFRCPYPGYRVQGYDVNDDESERADRAFVGVTCAARGQKVKPAHGWEDAKDDFVILERGKVCRSHPQRHHRPKADLVGQDVAFPAPPPNNGLAPTLEEAKRHSKPDTRK
jgi:hypothetical protein